MVELEGELVALGAALDLPAAPHLATRVGAAIELGPSSRRRWLAVAAAAAVIGGTGIAAAPVVADWLGVGGVEVRQESPEARLPAAKALDLGRRTTLAAAKAGAGFPLVVPAQLGDPDEVWVDRSKIAPTVWFAYRPRAGLPAARATGYGALLAQAPGSVADEPWATKFTEGAARIERVEIGTGRALWVEGTHHILWRDHQGNIVVDQLRLSDNSLLWERGKVTLRLESALGRVESEQIARSVR